MKVVIKLIPTKVYDILINLFPMIILFTVVMSSIRIISCLYSKEKINVYKDLKNLIYIIYCFALFNLVTTTDFESYSNNFIPFKEIMRYKTSSPLFYRNVIGNIALFIPFGYIITDMIKEKATKCNILITFSITLLTSLTIEIIQMFIDRSFDIDDIILNIAGGLIGFTVFTIIHGLSKNMPEKYRNDKYKIISFLAILFIFFILFAVCYKLA